MSRYGKLCRVGYYGRTDGLGVVWLVDEDGTYCEMAAQDAILDFFDIVTESDVTDYFGDSAAPFSAINSPSPEWMWTHGIKRT